MRFCEDVTFSAEETLIRFDRSFDLKLSETEASLRFSKCTRQYPGQVSQNESSNYGPRQTPAKKPDPRRLAGPTSYRD